MDEQWSSDTGTSEGEVTSIVAELGRRLEILETGLGEATRGAAEIKALLPRVAALEAVLGDLEATMARVRQQIRSADTPQAETAPSPGLWPVPRAEPAEAGGGPEAPPTAEEGPAEAAGPAEPARRCFRLEVEADQGSLDLKAVDRSVSENAGVVDVALLDYDGRRASLKIWVEQEAEPEQVQSALLERLKANLGAEGESGEVSISLSEEPAA
ncbi:MAG: hypothetical protein WBF66_04135 [Dehalococcoidia bacterium]